MKCYRVNVTYYVYADDEEGVETTLQDAGLTNSEYYSFHDIEEDEDWEYDNTPDEDEDGSVFDINEMF